MKSYQLVDHPADIKFFLQASSIEELFNAGLEGMASIISPQCCNAKSSQNYTLSLSSIDQTTLLIDFLSSILTQTHTEKTVFCSAAFDTLTQTKLVAIMHGIPVKKFYEDIKAVTYHEANIQQDSNGLFCTTVVFDI